MRLARAVFLLLSAAVAAAPAQQPDTSVRLTVTLDHTGWMYHVGDSARFSVTLMRAGKPVPGSHARIDLARERLAPMRRDSIALGGGSYSTAGALTAPGFLRLTARTTVNGASYTALATAAFDPETIRPSITAPADFEAFWRDAIADARRVPLKPVMTRVPTWSTPDVDVYHVSFQNQAANSRLYGVLSVPTKPGRYPALLVVPGAGVRPYFPSVATAKRGVIHLAIGIHGIPVDRDSLLYNELRATALARYYTYGLEDRDLYYYKRVIVGVIRAGDFLFTLPQMDGTNYAVQGGSQGGGLSIIAGALDPRVKGIVVSHPAMADQLGYLAGYGGGWPHVFSDTTPVRAKAEKLETLRYYDVVNFARLLKVPGIYSWGYNDAVVPASAVYATYNIITAPKQSVIVPEGEHARTPLQESRMNDWLFALLGRR